MSEPTVTSTSTAVRTPPSAATVGWWRAQRRYRSTVDVRRARAVLQIEDGMTIAIGGLVQNTINGSTAKIPLLGDIPFLGTAFSSVEYNEREEELLILVTPRLVAPMSCCQLPKFLPGRETRSPDDFELFLTQILEAPRGQREVCPEGMFRAAHKNGPTANLFPCNDNTPPFGSGHLGAVGHETREVHRVGVASGVEFEGQLLLPLQFAYQGLEVADLHTVDVGWRAVTHERLASRLGTERFEPLHYLFESCHVKSPSVDLKAGSLINTPG